VCALASVLAAVLVVLDDGEAIRGQDVHRQDDRVSITVDAHRSVLVPLRRVVEVRQLPEPSEEARAAEPSGVVRAKPRQLAGEPVEPASAREQTAALGEPSRFTEDKVRRGPWPRSDWPSDPRKGNNFAPSDWAEGPHDPDWTPTAGFQARGLPPARAMWTRSPIPPEWNLADAWRGHRALFGTSSVRPAAPREKVEACWRRIVAADRGGPGEGAQVSLLEGRPWEALPIPLYEVERRSGGRLQRTIFAVEGDVCRPIAGDVPATAGVVFPPQTSIRGYNRSLTAAPRPLPVGEPVARALALATLADPAAMGAERDRVVLLGASADLDRLATNEPLSCELSSRARRRVHALARPSVAPPQVKATHEEQVVTFWTWSPRGGVLARHVVRVTSSGSVTLDTEEVAHHLGEHRDPPS
jgi:hypothetical protein